MSASWLSLKTLWRGEGVETLSHSMWNDQTSHALIRYLLTQCNTMYQIIINYIFTITCFFRTCTFETYITKRSALQDIFIELFHSGINTLFFVDQKNNNWVVLIHWKLFYLDIKRVCLCLDQMNWHICAYYRNLTFAPWIVFWQRQLLHKWCVNKLQIASHERAPPPWGLIC